ncbi:trans-1,2-dihydrobenzene-1,2-diol dehydrogenase [Nasonia vitripennis]|uniref:Trans-1,2-dihydrobenzene-1,2-diol dehydrogenase n=1 Tax=Nasonia vitripennis TaxID=7425 RepID=A0A7M7G8Z9_NASVI|nr:trans-1,2-dihydrobenzene-1,2-diol dehydrogenase [Nasonia vitripennis]XP_032454295.1 trans-1,2-dihydrobenzene-1,2-diol dehydrogenase [Nasonia vitripennis]
MATRWGIAGAGKISHDFVSAVSSLPKSEHQLLAVAARDAQRAKDFAKLHDIPSAYGSYSELANDGNVEVVYIGTLNPSHFELGKLMLNAGKHVLCEKPLTMNAKQTRELIELAESKKLFLMEGIWSRCFPAYDTLRRELANKSIGEVKQLTVGFGFAGLSEIERLNSKELGGGTILDLGVYVIQLASLVFEHDKPTAIRAVGHVNKEGVDESMSASITYSNARTATIYTHSQVELPNRAHVIGTEGTISLPSFWCPPSIETPSGLHTVELPKINGRLNFINSSGFVYEAAEVRDCLKKGLLESPKVTHANSIYIAEIEDELRRQIGVVYEADK